jgi:hypothetical protein
MDPPGYMTRSSGDDVFSCCHAIRYIGFVRTVEGARRLPFMARLRHADRIERCPLSSVTRKTSTQAKFLRVDAKATSHHYCDVDLRAALQDSGFP